MGSAVNKSALRSEVVILPESDDHTLCLRLNGVISVEDFIENIQTPLTSRVDNGGNYNLMIHYDSDFQGWEKEAAQMSFQSIIDYGLEARKLAYVNAPDSKLLQVKMARPLLGGEIRFFDQDEFNEAIEWVKA